MSNPFEVLEQRLVSIETMLQSMQNNKLIPVIKESKEEQPMTQLEAARFLGKSRQTLVAWRKQGHIKAYRIGGRIYFKPSELTAALQSLR